MQRYHTFLIAGVLMFTFGFATCQQHDTPRAEGFKHDHEEISKMLDAAILSEAPVDSFKILLNKVKAYPSVDSAWIDGVTFYLKYKHGGTIFWTAPPQPTIKPTTGERKK